MKRIALLSVTGSVNDCYECNGNKELELICDFEEVSDEDYAIIRRAIERQQYGQTPRYIMIEPSSVEQVKEDLKSVLLKLKKEDKEYKERDRIRKEANAKRQATLKAKREEKERKKFEELRKKFEESNKDQG